MADRAKKSLPKRTGKEQKKRMMNNAHERRKRRVEARVSAQRKREQANRKAGKEPRQREPKPVLDRWRREWRIAVAFAEHNTGGKYA